MKLYLKLSYALAILFRENKISAENVVHFFHIRRNIRKNFLLSVDQFVHYLVTIIVTRLQVVVLPLFVIVHKFENFFSTAITDQSKGLWLNAGLIYPILKPLASYTEIEYFDGIFWKKSVYRLLIWVIMNLSGAITDQSKR